MEFPINIDQQTLKLKSNLKTWGKLLAKSVAFIVLPAAVIIQKMTRMGGMGGGCMWQEKTCQVGVGEIAVYYTARIN